MPWEHRQSRLRLPAMKIDTKPMTGRALTPSAGLRRLFSALCSTPSRPPRADGTCNLCHRSSPESVCSQCYEDRFC